MQKHELNEFIINLVGATKGMQIITAVDAYSSASNGAKPDVMCSVCPDCAAYNKKTDDELTKCWNCGEGYRAN